MHIQPMAERKNIPLATKLRLFAQASGHCQRPECLQTLFPVEMGGDNHIAEMAHLIPHGERGPRHLERPDEEFDPDSFDNLILLCPTCHTTIDKIPDAYPRSVLLGWKRDHLANLALNQGIIAYDVRADVREALAARMAENKAIWEKFAPIDGSDFKYDPESETSRLWSHRVRSVILPNHFQTLSIIAANLHHVTTEERATYAEYKEHVRGLAQRHICGEAGSAIRFPARMERIFT